MIKITYVAELPFDGELINFVLPGCVAPWTKDAALATKVQVLGLLIKTIEQAYLGTEFIFAGINFVEMK